MPELPEVETVVRGLRNKIDGLRIKSVTLNRENLRYPFPDNFVKVLTEDNPKVININRRAKYILIELSNGYTLIIHLGMSGRLVFDLDNYRNEKHAHVLFEFFSKDNKEDESLRAIYIDPRRFGYMDVVKTENIHESKYFAHLGPEPFSEDVNGDKFYEMLRLRGGKSIIKQALLDQKMIVGVGNIYVCEALFESKINPDRLCKDITKAEAVKLLENIRNILKDAIKAGGTTLKDHRTIEGDLGYFQQSLKVYGRGGELCENCGSKIIRKTHGGRSTFYCKSCQR